MMTLGELNIRNIKPEVRKKTQLCDYNPGVVCIAGHLACLARWHSILTDVPGF